MSSALSYSLLYWIGIAMAKNIVLGANFFQLLRLWVTPASLLFFFVGFSSCCCFTVLMFQISLLEKTIKTPVHPVLPFWALLKRFLKNCYEVYRFSRPLWNSCVNVCVSVKCDLKACTRSVLICEKLMKASTVSQESPTRVG